MGVLHVEAEGTTSAGPEVVWAMLADVTQYAVWGPWDDCGYEQPGKTSPHGVGAVRRLRYGWTTTIEEILEIDEGRRLAYTVIRGIPVKDYRGEVTLTPSADGTHIRWTADWRATVPGRAVRLVLRNVFPKVVAGLVAAADAVVAGP